MISEASRVVSIGVHHIDFITAGHSRLEANPAAIWRPGQVPIPEAIIRIQQPINPPVDVHDVDVRRIGQVPRKLVDDRFTRVQHRRGAKVDGTRILLSITDIIPFVGSSHQFSSFPVLSTTAFRKRSHHLRRVPAYEGIQFTSPSTSEATARNDQFVFRRMGAFTHSAVSDSDECAYP
jgi:hypothetical protein